MSNEVISDGLPEGWLIKVEWEMRRYPARSYYRAFRWRAVEKNATRKRWWAKEQVSGWKRTTIVHRHLEDTITEVAATVSAEGASVGVQTPSTWV